MAEIIDFKSKVKKPSEDIKEYYEDPEIEEITDAILSASLDSLIRLGYNLEKDFDDILPSIILLKESIISLQLKLKHQDHPLQDYAKDVFIIDNN